MYKDIVLLIFISSVFGWIPILALCKGISWIVEAFHPEPVIINKNEDEESDNT